MVSPAKVGWVFFAGIWAIIFALMIGWVMNIVKLWNSDLTVITGETVLRVVSIFVAPLGGVIGWF